MTPKMVSSDLDELILQVFEEQEESFYFPITSQNTARNFVKALHNKGIEYESVYKEIGEFEHNFSAWRKGLGRIGIGNRIIERINQPLEEVLIEEEQEDLQEILARLKEKDSRPGNDRVPPIDKPQDDSRLQRIKDNIGRQKDDKSKARQEKDITDSWRDNIDTKVTASSKDTEVKVTESKVTESKVPLSRKASDDLKLSRKASDDSDRHSSTPGSPHLSRAGSGRIPGAELVQKEPGVVDFRSVLKRRNNEDKSSVPGAGDRRSMPSSFLLESNERNKMSIMTGSADRINRIGERKSWLDERNLKSRAESEPRIVPGRETAAKSEPKPKMKSSVLENLKKDEPEEKSDSDNDSLSEFVDANEEPLPPSPPKAKAPLAGAETSDTDTTESGAERSNASSGMVSTDVSSTDDEDSKPEDKSTKTTEDKPPAKPTRAQEEPPRKLIENSDELPTIKIDLNQTNGTDNGTASDDGSESDEDDVGENYDSEWDEENGELNVDGRKIAAHITRYKEETRGKDGSGFIYIFSDSKPTDTVPRIKVSASRFPHKRLEQALLFNLDMRLVATYSVGERHGALAALGSTMNVYDIPGQDGWYQGPLEDMVNTVGNCAERFPNTTSEC